MRYAGCFGTKYHMLFALFTEPDVFLSKPIRNSNCCQQEDICQEVFKPSALIPHCRTKEAQRRQKDMQKMLHTRGEHTRFRICAHLVSPGHKDWCWSCIICWSFKTLFFGARQLLTKHTNEWGIALGAPTPWNATHWQPGNTATLQQCTKKSAVQKNKKKRMQTTNKVLPPPLSNVRVGYRDVVGQEKPVQTKCPRGQLAVRTG